MSRNFLKNISPILVILGLITSGFVFAQKYNKPGIDKREEAAAKKEEIMPPFEFIYPREGVKIEGETQLKGRVKSPNSIEFYYQNPGAPFPVYLGKAQPKVDNIWEYQWDTKSIPNGNYEIFAKITNQYGEYESSGVKIKIGNEVRRDEEKEVELKEKIEVAKKEIEKEDKEITEKKEKVAEEIKELTKETKKVLEGEEKNKVEPEVAENLKETEHKIEKKLEELAGGAREVIKIEKQIENKEREKKEIEEKVQSVQDEVKEVQLAAAKLPEGQKKEEAKVVEEIRQEKLEGRQKEKERTENDLESLREVQELKKKETEKVKTEIINVISEAVKPVEDRTQSSEKPKIFERRKAAEEKTASLLEDLEKKVKEKEEIKIEKSRVLLKDSDKDGLSDEEELRLGTNPVNPDSDSDGFLDEAEIETGYNPLESGPTDKIIYQDPKNVLPKKSEIYRVEKVERVVLPGNETGLKFGGKGLPDSFVTLYIFSTPVVVVVKTDSNGYWEYTLDKQIADGEHRVYAALTNNRGELQARSETFVFLKAGEKVFRIFETPAEAVSPVQALEKPFIVLIFAIIILALGLALITINVLTKKKTENLK